MLTRHQGAYSTGYERQGNVLFNDALNTFYLRLYVVGHMVKYHSDSERGNPLPPHRLLFLINSKGSFIFNIPLLNKEVRAVVAYAVCNLYHIAICYTNFRDCYSMLVRSALAANQFAHNCNNW